MTTICTNGHIIAADTYSDGYSVPFYHCKLEIINGTVLGGCGITSDVNAFFEWYSTPVSSRKKPEFTDNFTILQLQDIDSIVYWDKGLVACEIDGSYAAIGSGAQAALAALHLGKDPVGAIYTAMKCDHYTGGNVDFVDLRVSPSQIVRVRGEMSEGEINREFSRLIDLGVKGVNL